MTTYKMCINNAALSHLFVDGGVACGQLRIKLLQLAEVGLVRDDVTLEAVGNLRTEVVRKGWWWWGVWSMSNLHRYYDAHSGTKGGNRGKG